MSWLSSAWDHNRNFLGNAVKNVSQLLAFTPLGPLGAGLAGAAGRGMQKGANFGDILKSGVSNAAIGSAAHGLYGAAQGAFGAGGNTSAGVGGTGGGSAGGDFAAGAAKAAPGPPVSVGGISIPGPTAAAMPSGPAWAKSLASTEPGSSFSSSLMNHLSGAGNFAKENATTLGGIGSGLLNAREQGQANDLKQQQFDFEKRQYEDQLAQRQRLAALLSPLYSQVYGRQTAMAPNPYGAPSNPYTSGNPYTPGAP